MYRTKLLGADSEHTTNCYDLFLVAHYYCASLPTSSPKSLLSIADMAQCQAQHVRVPMSVRRGNDFSASMDPLESYTEQPSQRAELMRLKSDLYHTQAG